MVIHPDEQTIIAQCTPSGNGAIALLRLSGDRACAIATSFSRLASRVALDHVATHTIHVGNIVDQDDEIVDQVLFLVMHSPKTFTGQDTVEITCHNNPFIIQHIIELAIHAGARHAGPGEFTKRAVLSNKIDILQAEAINEIIHANTPIALKKSLAQLRGSLSSCITTIEELLQQAHVLTEASFEFLDDEMSFAKEIHVLLEQAMKIVATSLHSYDKLKQVRDGMRIAIIGTVNAGKSSLFNALTKAERAIVTPIPGTTRDTIEYGVYQYGTYITYIDTAGIRVTDDVIEQCGIERSHRAAAEADIILLVVDGSRHLAHEEELFYTSCSTKYGAKVIVVLNKTDIQEHAVCAYGTLSGTASVSCSCQNGYGIDMLQEAIKKKIQELLTSMNAPYLLNERQGSMLTTVHSQLQEIIAMVSTQEPPYELIAESLKGIISCTRELTGKTVSEDSMEQIFKKFCVGK